MSTIDEMVEEALFLGIVRQAVPPNKEAYDEGYQAHADGTPYGPGKYPLASSKGLSWRIGWNDRALQERD